MGSLLSCRTIVPRLPGSLIDGDCYVHGGLPVLQHNVTSWLLLCCCIWSACRASASALQVLDLTKASLDNQLPLLLALEGATKLSALSLSGTQLADDYLPTIAACTFLHTLNLSLNPDITAAGLTATLPGFAAWLERLDLRGTGVGNTLLPLLKHLPKLQQLVLADTAVSWERKAAPATAGEGDAAGGHAAAVPPRGDALAGLPAWHGELAAGAPVVQCAGPEKPPSGWAQLQVLDVAGAQLTDAGCAELAADMGGAAAAAQAHASAAAGYSSGLRVLRIGTSRHKLGRKALASIGHLTSLQQLTLQVIDACCAKLLWRQRFAGVQMALSTCTFPGACMPQRCFVFDLLGQPI